MGFDTFSRMLVCNVSKFTSRFSYDVQQFMCINFIFSLEVYQKVTPSNPRAKKIYFVFIRRVLCETLHKMDF